MRIVLDTNVFVSAILKVNSLPFLVVRWIDRHGGLLKSAVTEQEILRVLARQHIAAVELDLSDQGRLATPKRALPLFRTVAGVN